MQEAPHIPDCTQGYSMENILNIVYKILMLIWQCNYKNHNKWQKKIMGDNDKSQTNGIVGTFTKKIEEERRVSQNTVISL